MKRKDRKTLRAYLSGKDSVTGKKLFDRWYDSFDDRPLDAGSVPEQEKATRRQRELELIKARGGRSRRPGSQDRTTALSRWPWQVAASVLLGLALGGLGWLAAERYGWFSAPATYVEHLTGAGQRLTVVLPDSSRVHLNAGSRVRYPASFDHRREVSLTGEAFFEVTPHPQRPFTVRAGKLVTTVLGTSFNVSAYPDQPGSRVAVATGKVRVALQNAGVDARPVDRVLLTANQQAVLDAPRNTLQKGAVDWGTTLAWRDNVLAFQNERLEEIARRLERWYGVRIELANPALKNCRLTGKYRLQPLEEVLTILGFTSQITYEFKTDRLVILRGKGCQ
ncbi:MAG: DUF4974 domain-containing protein [Ferruginibacter sp.]|nr:DUF4974 domain-containing protein [Cytophagales bacterium]